MSGLVQTLFGGQTSAQKQAAAQQQAATAQAQAAQTRASRAAEEDAAMQAANQSASTRIARGQGRRVLAFQGVDTGVPGPAATLGG